MSDFEEMARRLQQSHAAAVAEKQEADRIAREQWNAEYEAAVLLLETEVTPLLLDAKSSFEKVNIPTQIEKNFDGSNGRHMRPEITFFCEGPKITNSLGGYEIPKSVKGFFKYSDGQLVVGTSKDNYANHIGPDKKTIDSDYAAAIKTAVAKVIDSYFADLGRIETSR